MGAVFTRVETFDLRFPTSAQSHGSDAMNTDPDYSAAYVVVGTDAADGLEGHGFAFTIGRGNEVQTAAIRALAPLILGLSVADVCADMGAFSRRLRADSQLRWLGPDKGVMQMAVAAVLNAVWDLAAKRAGKPLWKLLVDMSPEEIVALVDFHYISDVLTPEQALAMLRRNAAGRVDRQRHIEECGFPAYTTSPGWLGYSDEQLAAACRKAAEDGWDYVKLKVGRDVDDDVRRCAIARTALGPSRRLMVDANQLWSVDEAIATIERLREFDLWWVEEPTHPDDVIAHARIAERIAPVKIAGGEHAPNAIVFKQFFESNAIAIAQVDACRSGGVNDIIATLLLAAKFDIPVCPHAGGVGLCELVQHLAIFDYVAVSCSLENRMIEFVDHLHEHFLEPAIVQNGRYIVPRAPGFSAAIRPESIEGYRFPDGAEWLKRKIP